MSGHPIVLNGQSCELNQVSSVSASCSSAPPHSHRSGACSATTIFPHALQYQAGMRWPHHSCREMHQSWMLYIQS